MEFQIFVNTVASEIPVKLKAYKCNDGLYRIGYKHKRNVKGTDEITLVEARIFLQQDLLLAVRNFQSLGLSQNKTYALAYLYLDLGPEQFQNLNLAVKAITDMSADYILKIPGTMLRRKTQAELWNK